jgi:hypothetical protein
MRLSKLSPTLLLLTAVILFFTPRFPLGVNDGSRFATVESLLMRGTFTLDASPLRNDMDTVFYKGHFYSDKAVFLPIFTAILLYPLNLILKFFGNSVSLHYLATLLTTGLALMLLYWTFRKTIRFVRFFDRREGVLAQDKIAGSLIFHRRWTQSHCSGCSKMIFSMVSL